MPGSLDGPGGPGLAGVGGPGPAALAVAEAAGPGAEAAWPGAEATWPGRRSPGRGRVLAEGRPRTGRIRLAGSGGGVAVSAHGSLLSACRPDY